MPFSGCSTSKTDHPRNPNLQSFSGSVPEAQLAREEMATTVAVTTHGTSLPVSIRNNILRIRITVANIRSNRNFPPTSLRNGPSFALACLPHPPPPPVSQSPTPSSNIKPIYPPSTKLYVSGLSFHTTEESLRNAFNKFGELVEVNLVMDKIAKRPRGFAFLRYATEGDSQKAIDGMHGKFLDGRVIFVEVAKPRSELRQRLNQNPR